MFPALSDIGNTYHHRYIYSCPAATFEAHRFHEPKEHPHAGAERDPKPADAVEDQALGLEREVHP